MHQETYSSIHIATDHQTSLQKIPALELQLSAGLCDSSERGNPVIMCLWSL